MSSLDGYPAGEDLFYRNVGVENDDVGVFPAFKRALMGEAHNFGGCFGEHFYGVGYGYSRFLYRYTDKSVRGRDASRKCASVHQLTHAVFDDKFGALHKAVSLIGSRKGEAVGNECDALRPLCRFRERSSNGQSCLCFCEDDTEKMVSRKKCGHGKGNCGLGYVVNGCEATVVDPVPRDLLVVRQRGKDLVLRGCGGKCGNYYITRSFILLTFSSLPLSRERAMACLL